MSLRGDGKSPGTTLKAARKSSGPTPTKRRNSTLWSETLDVHQKSSFSVKEIKRQELPGLNAYKNYCSNQLAAKALLDQKKQDKRVQDFLQRCLESPFSRKLDLWSFLDVPRSRLVKYPLLLREILRHTPPDHPDVASLERAITIIQDILSEINVRKGETECQYYIDQLEFLDEKQRDPLIDECRTLLCHGELRTKSGSVSASTSLLIASLCYSEIIICMMYACFSFNMVLQRLHVFLFSELLVLTRPVTRNDRSCFQVYRQPIAVRDLVLEDLQDGEIRLGGSFRGAFTNGEKGKLSCAPQ
ncbi:hypothetical protein GOODEAATRI_009980 [Goodea atripinnis]|uniref:DH domain-containing protein n=1 Tax=Goodea atripinnis TaxID=208336 RepID=A0ABV0MQU5_9TELE